MNNISSDHGSLKVYVCFPPTILPLWHEATVCAVCVFSGDINHRPKATWNGFPLHICQSLVHRHSQAILAQKTLESEEWRGAGCAFGFSFTSASILFTLTTSNLLEDIYTPLVFIYLRTWFYEYSAVAKSVGGQNWLRKTESTVQRL